MDYSYWIVEIGGERMQTFETLLTSHKLKEKAPETEEKDGCWLAIMENLDDRIDNLQTQNIHLKEQISKLKRENRKLSNTLA